MKKAQVMACASVLAIISILGCNRPNSVRSVAKEAPSNIPGGTLILAFTRKVRGPVELSLDGTRVHVLQGAKGGKTLQVTGVHEGRHRYFIQSTRDAFGPDQGELDMNASHGVYYVIFAQRFNSVLYGKTEPPPPEEGIPGVRAILK